VNYVQCVSDWRVVRVLDAILSLVCDWCLGENIPSFGMFEDTQQNILWAWILWKARLCVNILSPIRLMHLNDAVIKIKVFCHQKTFFQKWWRASYRPITSRFAVATAMSMKSWDEPPFSRSFPETNKRFGPIQLRIVPVNLPNCFVIWDYDFFWRSPCFVAGFILAQWGQMQLIFKL